MGFEPIPIQFPGDALTNWARVREDRQIEGEKRESGRKEGEK